MQFVGRAGNLKADSFFHEPPLKRDCNKLPIVRLVCPVAASTAFCQGPLSSAKLWKIERKMLLASSAKIHKSFVNLSKERIAV